MATRQATKTRVHYSCLIRGKVRTAVFETHHARLHESALKAIEQGIQERLTAFTQKQGFSLRPNEPSVFIYDIQHVKG